MESCLLRLNEYEESNNNKENSPKTIGKLRSLNGMRVVVGRYLGLDDRGRCIVPWDWTLRERETDYGWAGEK